MNKQRTVGKGSAYINGDYKTTRDQFGYVAPEIRFIITAHPVLLKLGKTYFHYCVSNVI